MPNARCIRCGCRDHRACVGPQGPCHWLKVDYELGIGVCSECEAALDLWQQAVARRKVDLERYEAAYRNAHATLKVGDRVRLTACPGTKRWIFFAGWAGKWIVSRSGRDDYSAVAIDRVNGEVVDFTIAPGAAHSGPSAGTQR